MRGLEELLRSEFRERDELTAMGLGIGDDLARHLASLEVTGMQLSRNHIGDRGAIALAGSRRLRELDISFNKVGDSGFGCLVNSSIEVLDVSGNEISTGAIEAHALEMRLRELTMSHLHLSTEGAAALAANTRLKTLNLAYANICEESIIVLCESPTLECVDVSWCGLSSSARIAVGRIKDRRPDFLVITEDSRPIVQGGGGNWLSRFGKSEVAIRLR